MVKSEFIKLFSKFDPRDVSSESYLEKISKIYPYFQTAHFFYVKTLQEQGKINFNNILEKTAILSYDRDVLMKWINRKFEKRKNNLEVLDKKLPIKNTANDDSKVSKQNNNSELTEQSSKEKLSFTQWISISSNKSFNTFYFNSNENQNDWKIVDSFLDKNPKIKRSQNFDSISNIDLSSQNIFSEEELMTETLAKIFIKQKKYNKAIQAFKILSLKYPEKNALFAVQINKIKNLIKTNP